MENSSTNGTTASSQTQTSLTSGEIFCIVMFCVIFVLGITANGLVIYVTGFKMKTTVNSVWFLNLALSDFICIFIQIGNIIDMSMNYIWIFGDFMCKFIHLIQMMCMSVSIFLLTVISLDRWLTVWVPVWAQNKRTPHKARLICVFVWLTSLVFSVPFSATRRMGEKWCVRSVDPFTNKQLQIIRFVVGFVVPFLIITCCYVAIGVRFSQIRREKKLRPYLLILALILGFFTFWLPIHINNLLISDQVYIYSIDPKLFKSHVFDIAQKTYRVSFILIFLHSCLSPFLYMLMCEEFKQKLKQSVFLVLEHAFLEEEVTPHQTTNLAL